jgi:hypothetical protein
MRYSFCCLSPRQPRAAVNDADLRLLATAHRDAAAGSDRDGAPIRLGRQHGCEKRRIERIGAWDIGPTRVRAGRLIVESGGYVELKECPAKVVDVDDIDRAGRAASVGADARQHQYPRECEMRCINVFPALHAHVPERIGFELRSGRSSIHCGAKDNGWRDRHRAWRETSIPGVIETIIAIRPSADSIALAAAKISLAARLCQ